MQRAPRTIAEIEEQFAEQDPEPKKPEVTEEVTTQPAVEAPVVAPKPEQVTVIRQEQTEPPIQREELVDASPETPSSDPLEPTPITVEAEVPAPQLAVEPEPEPMQSSFGVPEQPAEVASIPEAEDPQDAPDEHVPPVEALIPEPLVPQPEAAVMEEVPYDPPQDPEDLQQIVVNPLQISPEPTERAVVVPEFPEVTTQSEITLNPETPAVTDSIEAFEIFVADLHDLEAPPEKLELVHEKVEKITELTVMIREAKLLDAGEGVTELTDELVEVFVELFEATGMNLSEEHIRHMVQLWIAHDVLAGKDFETAQQELFEDKGMREVLQQFMHGISRLKEMLESLHVRLGKLVLTSTPQPAV